MIGFLIRLWLFAATGEILVWSDDFFDGEDPPTPTKQSLDWPEPG